MTTKYETVYILEPSYDEVKAQEFCDKVTGWMKDLGGEVVEIQKWGKRRLAYEVRKRRDGVYTMIVWNGGGPMVKELERRIALEEDVMRVAAALCGMPYAEAILRALTRAA